MMIKKPNCTHPESHQNIFTIVLPEHDIKRVYCAVCLVDILDKAFEYTPSKCDHEMETSGSGTYCLKPDCDVNWV